MSISRLLDAASALLMSGVLLAVACYGVLYAQFAVDFDSLVSARNGERPVEAMGYWRRPPDVKPWLDPWTGYDGMGGAARRLIALDTDTPQNTALRFVDVSKALVGEPTSGWLWLEYTALCLKLSFCAPKAEAPRSMIEVTARREGLIMLEEAFVAIEHWDVMPDAAKARAVSNLIETLPRAGAEGGKRLRAAITAKSPEAQTEIRALVLAKVNNDRGWQKRLGL